LKDLRDRQVNLIAVSSLPEALGVFPPPASPLTITVEYLPGDVNGIANFFQFDGQLAQTDLILVLAARPERLRWWAEQNIAATAALQTAAPRPMAATLSANAAPQVIPYLQTRDFQGWLVGLPGAIAYSQRLGNVPDATLLARLDALMLTQWMAVVLLVLGAFYGFAAGNKRKR